MAEFQITTSTNNNIEELLLHGYLDAHTAPQWEAAIGVLVQQGKYNILVNFRELDYISSAGLGVFMVFIEEVRNNNGDIKLCEMKPKVYTVFDLLGFPMLFEILPTSQEATDKFTTSNG